MTRWLAMPSLLRSKFEPRTKRMSRALNGTSAYLIGSSAVVTAEPLTMACWFKAANVTAAHVLMSIGTNAGAPRWQIVENAFSSQIIQTVSSTAGGSGTSSGGSGTVSGVWRHFAGVFTSVTSRQAFLDGAAQTADATSVTITGVNRTLIGARINSTVGAFASGSIAEAAIWNVALNASELASLAKGIVPLKVRTPSLVFYAPLIRDVKDLHAALALTDNGPSTKDDHPRIYR